MKVTVLHEGSPCPARSQLSAGGLFAPPRRTNLPHLMNPLIRRVTKGDKVVEETMLGQMCEACGLTIKFEHDAD